MSVDDWIGSAGVALLLVAFFLNMIGTLGPTSRVYQGLNFAGAALACYASYRIGFIPFVVLEGIWALVALLSLATVLNRTPGKLANDP